MFCPAGPLGANMGIPTWAFPCWSHLGPTSFFTWDTLGHYHLGIPMLVPSGTYIFFHMGYTWALPIGHSPVVPNWDPYLFSYGIHLGTPNWAFPCCSQLGPIFIFILGYTWAPPMGHFHVGPKCDPHLFFIWDTLGHAHYGIPMFIPHGTHIFFHVGYTWALTNGTHIYFHFSLFLLGSLYVPIWAFLVLFQMILCK